MGIGLAAPLLIFLFFSMTLGLGATALVFVLARARRPAVGAEDAMTQLRDEMREMRDSMEARFAEITLTLDDMEKRQLPPRADRD